MSVTLSGYAFVLPNVLARSACVQKKKKIAVHLYELLLCTPACVPLF